MKLDTIVAVVLGILAIAIVVGLPIGFLLM
jgi:hypothetical protein